jgi:hypothetical protein
MNVEKGKLAEQIYGLIVGSHYQQYLGMIDDVRMRLTSLGLDNESITSEIKSIQKAEEIVHAKLAETISAKARRPAAKKNAGKTSH